MKFAPPFTVQARAEECYGQDELWPHVGPKHWGVRESGPVIRDRRLELTLSLKKYFRDDLLIKVFAVQAQGLSFHPKQ